MWPLRANEMKTCARKNIMGYADLSIVYFVKCHRLRYVYHKMASNNQGIASSNSLGRSCTPWTETHSSDNRVSHGEDGSIRCRCQCNDKENQAEDFWWWQRKCEAMQFNGMKGVWTHAALYFALWTAMKVKIGLDWDLFANFRSYMYLGLSLCKIINTVVCVVLYLQPCCQKITSSAVFCNLWYTQHFDTGGAENHCPWTADYSQS